MPRNGSGNMSTPNTFVPGTTITASDHNANWSDNAAEITNSLALDGQSSMNGQFKAASGTQSIPGVSFATDTGSGLYRIGSSNIGVSLGGVKSADWSSAGWSITGTLSITGAFTSGGIITAPAGTVAAPAYSFASNSAAGLYQIATDNLGVAVAGAKVIDIAAAGVGITGTLTASGAVTASNGLTVSAGSVSLPSASISSSALAAGNNTAFSTQLLHVRHVVAANTADGSLVAGSFTKRSLNTAVTNEITGASLATSQITLPAGTYFIEARCPVYLQEPGSGATDNAVSRLRNTTDSADTLIGNSSFLLANVASATRFVTQHEIKGRFTIAAQKVFELQTTTLRTTTGGQPVNLGVSEVYSEALIWKIG